MRRTLLALLLLGAATPALAQTPPAPPPGGVSPHQGKPMRGGMLMRADANGDGTVTRAEAVAAADARFDRLDADRDGKVTPEEKRQARGAMRDRGRPDGAASPPPTEGARPPRPKPLPSTMTREDMRSRALEAFARADTNGDGVVDKAERDARRRPHGHGPRGERPGGDMPPPRKD